VWEISNLNGRVGLPCWGWIRVTLWRCSLIWRAKRFHLYSGKVFVDDRVPALGVVGEGKRGMVLDDQGLEGSRDRSAGPCS
jgi:hypothetical protein